MRLFCVQFRMARTVVKRTLETLHENHPTRDCRCSILRMLQAEIRTLHGRGFNSDTRRASES